MAFTVLIIHILIEFVLSMNNLWIMKCFVNTLYVNTKNIHTRHNTHTFFSVLCHDHSVPIFLEKWSPLCSSCLPSTAFSTSCLWKHNQIGRRRICFVVWRITFILKLWKRYYNGFCNCLCWGCISQCLLCEKCCTQSYFILCFCFRLPLL